MRFVAECEVLSNENVAPNHFRMRLRAPELARAARPGQFCMIETAKGFSPFLRRPMCFERLLPNGFSILYKVTGEGTRILAGVLPGARVSVQGPLGNGFPIDTTFDRHVIVAGGIGVAPFPALVQALVHAGANPPEVVLGARSQDQLVGEDEFRRLGCAVHIATDDGSAGVRALASECLARLAPGAGTRIYACGPMAMMKATARVAIETGADCLVSLEAHMACGDGVCLGCVVESTRAQEGEPMVRVCQDGPVFDMRLIDWDALDPACGV